MKNDIIAIDVSEDYTHHVDRLLERSKLEIFEWFERPSETCRVKTYIYKDIESLREGLRRRLNREYPWYLQACQVDEDKEKGIVYTKGYYTYNGTTWVQSSFTEENFKKIISFMNTYVEMK